MKVDARWALGAAVAVMFVFAGCKGLILGRDAKKAAGDQYEAIQKYFAQADFAQRVPHLKAESYAIDPATDERRRQIQADIDRAFDEGFRRLVDKVRNSRVEKATKEIMALVESACADAETNGFALCSAKFEQAREISWNACLNGKLDGADTPEIDEKVRAALLVLVETKVNPRHWPIIERELRLIADGYSVDAKFDEGIAAVKGYPAVRVYTRALDDRLDAVAGELLKLGVPAAKIAPLSEVARKAMSVAANIVHLVDQVDEEEKEVRLDDGANPDVERYRQLLKEYHDALLDYNCTPDNADKMTKTFAAVVEKMIGNLRRDPKFGKEFLKHIKRLGTASINKRLVALREELVVVINENRKARDAAMAPIAELVKQNDLKAAQELATKALLTLNKNSKEAKFLRQFYINYIMTKVNPELWKKIESEVLAKTEEFVKTRQTSAGVAWLKAYPYVRTYAEEIDLRYADVKAEAVALGVPEAVAGRFIDEVAVLTAKADNLANFDDFTFERVTPGTPLTEVQLAKFEQALAASRKSLVDNDCTETNADKLVKEIRDRFTPEFAKVGGETRETVLVLGSCAINVRLDALREKCAAAIIARTAAAFAEEGKFAEARASVRDVALTGDDCFDAKVYALRVGTLNAIVNPLQFVDEKAKAGAKFKSYVAAGDYRGLVEWVKKYPGVHDDYAEIIAAVEAIRKAAVGIKVGEEDAKDYAEKLIVRLNTLLEKRKGEYFPPEAALDMKEVLAAVSELQSAVLAQFFDTEFVSKVGERVPEEVVALLRKERPAVLTTWELNENLRGHLKGLLEGYDIPELIKQQEYLELLARMDADFSYDSQVAMAEDAIAKQLGVRDPRSHLLANAVLGEYARSMRLLKLGNKLDADQLAAVVFGAVYLDQASVFDYASKKLQADANAVSTRDSLARTPLLLAIQLGRTSFLHRLVAAGAKVDAVDALGDTAVHYAVRRGNIAVLKAMLDKSTPDVKNKAGRTPLFVAAEHNLEAAVAALVEAEAKRKGDDEKGAAAFVNIADGDGTTAFDVACATGSRDVLDALSAAGAAFGAKQLAIAAAGDHLGVSQWLVAHGADVNGDGVMSAAVCGSETKQYLVDEGGVAPECDCPICCKCTCADGKCKCVEGKCSAPAEPKAE